MSASNSLRCLVATHRILSPIQAGVQAAHAVAELLVKHPEDSLSLKWAMDHKTLIILNGGNTQNLKELEKHCSDPSVDKFEWASFRESEDFADGLLTAVAVVVPEYITSRKIPATEFVSFAFYHGLSKAEIEIAQILRRLHTV